MQIFKKTEARQTNAFITKLEVIVGGGTIAVKDLSQPIVNEGTPVGVDANGLYHVVKTAKLVADVTNVATDYPVAKGHNFKIGDFLAQKTGGKAYAISSIDTTAEDRDILTVGTTLGLAGVIGDVIIQASAESATTTSALKHSPIGLIGTSFDVIEGDNHLSDIVVRGSVKEALISPLSAEIKALMPLIRFV